jgi:hypothetical protein
MVLRAERGGIGFVSDSAATGSLFIINVQTRSEAEAFRSATLSQKLPYSASRHVRFTPKADIPQHRLDVRFVPIGDTAPAWFVKHDLGRGGSHRDEKREIGANGRRWSRQFTAQLPGKRADHPHAELFACHRVKSIGKSDAFISD